MSTSADNGLHEAADFIAFICKDYSSIFLLLIDCQFLRLSFLFSTKGLLSSTLLWCCL